jgi:hypothetical protein
MTMLQRLANVIHWLCILLAGYWGFMVYALAVANPNHSVTPMWLIGLGGAALLWGIGWTVNYVLTGRTTLIPK